MTEADPCRLRLAMQIYLAAYHLGESFVHGTLEWGRVELVVADKYELGVLGQNGCRDLPLIVVRSYVQERVARYVSRVLYGKCSGGVCIQPSAVHPHR